MENKLNDLLILLCRSIANRKIYPGTHPKILKQVDDFHQALRDFLVKSGEADLFVGIIEGNIVYQGRNLVGPSIIGRQLVDFASKLKCGGITFGGKVTPEEIGELFNLVSTLNTPLETLQEARDLLSAHGVTNIRLAYHYTTPSGLIPKEQQLPWQGKDSNQILESPALIYQALFDAVSSAHGNASKGNNLDLDNTHTVSEYLLEHTRTNFSDMMQQIHYPDFDTYTVGHSVRVATLAVFAGTQMNLPEEDLIELGTAGLLHDVGKSKIPESILFKTGKLTAEEFSVIQTHSQLGTEILLAQENTTELDIAAAWGHHIRYDGKGYPSPPPWGVKNPLTSLIQICDVFEALTAIRPYKAPMTPQSAFTIMLNDKGAFHPGILASFIAAVGLYPPGNLVRLSDGSRGTVTAVGNRIDRPQVEITHTVDGAPLDSEQYFTIDLGKKPKEDLYISRLQLD